MKLDALKTDINDVVTSKQGENESISPELLGGVMDKMAEFSASPELNADSSTKIGEIGGKEIYRRMFIEPNGEGLDQLDLSLPEGHALKSITSSRENLDKCIAYFEIRERESVVVNGNTVIIKGANGEFTIGGTAVTTADLAITFDGGILPDETINVSYADGNDLALTLPTGSDTWKIKTVVATNVTGGTLPANFQNYTSEMEFVVNAVSTVTTRNQIHGGGSAYTVFQNGVNNNPDTWEIYTNATKLDLVVTDAGVLVGDQTLNTTTIRVLVTFPDSTTELATLDFATGDLEVVFQLQKDLTGVADGEITFLLEPSTVFKINDDGTEVDNTGLTDTNTSQFIKKNYLTDNFNLSDFNEFVIGFSLNFIAGYTTTLDNIDGVKNVIITMDHIDVS